MFRNILLAAALTMAGVPVAAQNAQQAAAPLTVAQLAENMQSVVGQQFEGGITLQAVSAEGNTLVITVSGPDGWRAGMTAQEASDALVGGFCSSMPDYFTAGRTMRVDTIDGKSKVKGPLAKVCAPPPPAGT